MIVREMVHRRLNAFLSLLGIVGAVALFVAFFTTGQAATRETTRLMRDIGFNLRILPEETDMERFWATGYSEHTMSERYVYDLAAREGLLYSHLAATLQKGISWRGRDVLLTGVAPEVAPPGKQKPPMRAEVERGTVFVGFEVARRLGLAEGDVIDLLGTPLTVARCLAEAGSEDDIRIYAHLKDVQEMLQMDGRINEIRALQCLCTDEGSRAPSLDVLREQLESVLPGTQVILIRSIAEARASQRAMAERYFAFIVPVVVIVSMAWIGLLALINVRERRQEIGIMRALGYGSGRIAQLFLGRAVAIGFLGALVGFAAGTGLALKLGPEIFRVTVRAIRPSFGLLYGALIASPSFCALSALVPTTVAVTQDPAHTLRVE